MIFKTILVYFSLLLSRKKEKNCLLVADFSSYGGTKTYFISLVKYLVSKNYEVTVLIALHQISPDILLLKSKFHFNIEILEFDIWRTRFENPVFKKINKTYFIYQINEFLYFSNIIKRLKPSLLICSTANPEWLLFLILFPCRVVYILHTVTMDKLDFLKKWMIRNLITKKKNIIVVSNAAKSYLLLNWFNSKDLTNIHVIYNYYEPNNLLDKSENSILTVLTIGSVEYYKNPLFWIDVCKKVINQFAYPVKFVWVGDGSMFEDCRNRTLNLPNIKFIGFTKDTDELYQSASIYFQPSIYESHGISVLGAMYNAIPCVVSNKGGLVESVVNNETCYIVEIDTIDQSVTAILSILNDNALRYHFGSNGFTKFNSTFTKVLWEKEMDKIIV